VEKPRGQRLVVLRYVLGTQFFERMRVRVVPDVVQQPRIRNELAIERIQPVELASLTQQLESLPREVIYPQCVIEACVSCSGIDEIGVTELPDVTEPLKYPRIDDTHGGRIEADRAPQGI